MGERIYFTAEVRNVKTMADGTVNVTLNLPETELPEAVQLLALAVRKPMVFVEVRTEA